MDERGWGTRRGRIRKGWLAKLGERVEEGGKQRGGEVGCQVCESRRGGFQCDDEKGRSGGHCGGELSGGT